MSDTPPPSGLWRMLLRFGLGSLALVLLAGTATATALLLEVDETFKPIKQQPVIETKVVVPTKPGKAQTILLLGSDRRWEDEKNGDPARSDSIMLVRLDPRNSAITTLSIPRDLRVLIPGHGLRKINDAFAEGGPDLAAQTVRNLTGLKIHHIVNVNFGGFRAAVNRLNCVYVDVDRRYFHSNVGVPISQRYDAIDIQPGLNRLCGSAALDYVRFRHADSDLVRAARQQDFLRAAKDQTSTGRLFSDRRALVKVFSKSIQTSKELHTTAGLLRLAKLGIAAGDNPVRQIKFPAGFMEEDKIQYVVADPAAIAKAVQQFLNPPDTVKRSKTKKARKARARAAKTWDREAELRRAKLDPAGEAGRAVAAEARGRSLGFPMRVPLGLAPGDRYIDPSPRVYSIADRSGKRHRAYRLVVVHNEQDGQFYGVEGTAWRSPPILAHPSAVRKLGGRKLELFRSGSKLRYVAWRTPSAVYWVSNTLTLDLTNSQMLGIARSLESVSLAKAAR